MTFKVVIYGAGSIGNHLSFACRQKRWNVSLVDVDSSALERTRSQIYPNRYGKWDSCITLHKSADDVKDCDIVIIGTPPDTHLELVEKSIRQHQPKVMLIEKPLCAPSELKEARRITGICKANNIVGLIGYNHNLTRNTVRAEELLTTGMLGEPQSIHVRWLEHWGGIFEAHPWLSGPSESYLGNSGQGGGACAEHSHAISLWQHFSSFLECGLIGSVTAVMDMYKDEQLFYDQTAYVLLETSSGLTGSVIQDVVSKPAMKHMRIQGTQGFLEWFSNYDVANDAIIYGMGSKKPVIEKFPRTRPDDFLPEINHIDNLIKGKEHSSNSPISLERGMHTMTVVTRAHESNQIRKSCPVHD